jgi:hypothetical protein
MILKKGVCARSRPNNLPLKTTVGEAACSSQMTRACRRWPSPAPERCRPRRRKKRPPAEEGQGLWSCAVVNCRRIRNAPAGRVGHTQRFRFMSTIEDKGYRIEKHGQIIALAAGHATAPVRTYSAFSTSLQRGMMGLAANEKRRCVITSLPDGLPDPAPPLAGDGAGGMRAWEVCEQRKSAIGSRRRHAWRA